MEKYTKDQQEKSAIKGQMIKTVQPGKNFK